MNDLPREPEHRTPWFLAFSLAPVILASLLGSSGRRVLCAAGALSVVACSSYEPVRPRLRDASGVRVRLERMTRRMGPSEIRVGLDYVPPRTLLKEAVIAKADAAPCRFGWAPLSKKLEVPDEPLPLSHGESLEHVYLYSGSTLLLVFGPEVSERLTGPTRLDLVFERDGLEKCVTVPLTSNDPALAWNRTGHLSLRVGLGARGYVGAPQGVQADIATTMQLAFREERTHVYVGAGIGFVSCDPSTCPPDVVDPGTPDERQISKTAAAMPLGAGIDQTWWQLGLFAFGTALEYDATYAKLPEAGGTETLWIHGLTLAPRVMLTKPDPIGPGLPGGVRNGFIALDVLAGGVVMGGDLAARLGARCLFAVPLQ